MLSSNGHFPFGSIWVCNKFLAKAFRFSNDMQVSGGSSMRLRLCLGSEEASSCPKGNKTDVEERSQARRAIISFPDRLSESFSNPMQRKTERHLPFLQKNQVYERFTVEYCQLDDSEPPSLSYFKVIWRHRCASSKVRKYSQFQICALYVNLYTRLRQAIDMSKNTYFLKEKDGAHQVRWNGKT